MPRPARPATPLVTLSSDNGELAATSERLNELAVLDNEAELRTFELAKKLGYDGPLDPDVIERGVVYQMRRTVEACLETGRMLLVLKERVGHGNLLQRLEKLGIEYRGAAKFMQAALKFANVPPAAHLTSAIGSPSKLIELLVLDEEEIKELSTEGSVLGISTDEIAAMSKSELRAKLRDARQTIAAKDKVIAKRDEKLARLEETAEAEQSNEEKALDQLKTRVLAAQGALMQLGALIQEFANVDLTDEFRNLVNNDVEYLAQTFEAILVQGGIPVNFQELVNPSFMSSSARTAKEG